MSNEAPKPITISKTFHPHREVVLTGFRIVEHQGFIPDRSSLTVEEIQATTARLKQITDDLENKRPVPPVVLLKVNPNRYIPIDGFDVLKAANNATVGGGSVNAIVYDVDEADLEALAVVLKK